MSLYQDMDVAVTGGAGFIGSHLVDRLLAMGAHVRIIDDLTSCGRDNIAHLEGQDSVTLEEADVRDGPAMMQFIQGADIVFHLATRNVRLSLSHPTEVHEVNVIGTYNVLKAASSGGAKRFLYSSSSEVHGTAAEVPLRENSECRPETIYGASKMAGEYYTQVFQRSGWLETVIARPHNTYGPREHFRGHRGEVIPRFILWSLAGKPPLVFGDGSQTRDFTYVFDTADCLAKLAVHKDASGQTFNICRGKEVSIMEIAQHIAQLTGLNITPEHGPNRPSDAMRLLGDPSRLMSIIGQKPETGIESGLSQTVDWFRNNIAISDDVLRDLEPINWKIVKPEDWLP